MPDIYLYPSKEIVRNLLVRYAEILEKTLRYTTVQIFTNLPESHIHVYVMEPPAWAPKDSPDVRIYITASYTPERHHYLPVWADRVAKTWRALRVQFTELMGVKSVDVWITLPVGEFASVSLSPLGLTASIANRKPVSHARKSGIKRRRKST